MDKFNLKKYLAEGKLLKEDFNYEEERAKLDTPERASMIARKLADLEDENEEEVIGNGSPYSDEIRRDEANNLADDIELEGDEKQTFIADLMKATEDTTSSPSGSPWDTFYDTANLIMKKYLAEGKLLKENSGVDGVIEILQEYVIDKLGADEPYIPEYDIPAIAEEIAIQFKLA